MQNKAILAALWIVSILVAYASGWFKGVAAAPRIAIQGASIIGYMGLGLVAVIVMGILYFFLTRDHDSSTGVEGRGL